MKQQTGLNSSAGAENAGKGAISAALQDRVAVGRGGVLVYGDVAGSIFVENRRMEVNADHGAVVNVYDGPTRVKKRDAIPHPGRPVRGFINRSSELKRLERVITDGDVATVHGIGGMGKTALLRQAANSSAALAHPDGVLFMEGIDEKGQALDTEDVIQRLFDKSFESEPHLKVNFDTAQTYLGSLRSLVVLDGLDLPVASLSRMPDLYPRSAMLIESNQWIDDDISAEVRLGPLPRNEAILLLAAKASFKLDDDLRPVIESVCALLADVPLALVLAGRAIREKGLSLEEAEEVLASFESRAADPHQAGIERAYALAQSTLTELERQWLAAAALAPGISIDPQYLWQMAEDESTAQRSQERLQSLGLLSTNNPRIRIHPGVRVLARRGVDEMPLRERFMSYLKERLEIKSHDWSFCADELGNIMGMIDWAARQQRWTDVISLSRGIDPYLTLNGLWGTWRSIIQAVLQAARRFGDPTNEAWALHQLGTHALGVGWKDQAIENLRQALDLRNRLGDTVGMAYTQHNLDLLIPPTSSGQDNGKPPDTPNGRSSLLGNVLKFTLKTILIAAVTIAGGLLAAEALTPPENPPVVPGIPVTGLTREPLPTTTSVPTSTRTQTPTKVPTRTLVPTKLPSQTPKIVTSTPFACEPKLTGLQNANCRVGPSTLFDVYGTLFEGQTVDILARNEDSTWLLVEHPQQFRNPCWIWKGPAVQEEGDISCTLVKEVPFPSEQQTNSTEDQAPADEGGTSDGPGFELPPLIALTIYPVCQPQVCSEGYYWSSYACDCQRIPQ